MFDYKHFITIYSKTEGISKTFHFDSDDIRNHVFHPSMDFTSMDNRMLIETNIQNLRSIARLLPENYLSTSNLDSILNNTDLDENSIRNFGLQHGLVDVKVCAVSEIFSGLKFMFRLKGRR